MNRALETALSRSKRRPQLVSRPERPKVQVLSRKTLREALLLVDPIIIVDAEQIHLPDRKTALEWMQRLPIMPDTLQLVDPA